VRVVLAARGAHEDQGNSAGLADPWWRRGGLVVTPAVVRWRRCRVVVIEYDTWARSLYANCVPPCGAAPRGRLVGCGAMAQLVARLHGMQKVRGSNPLSSTPGQRPVPIFGTGLFHVVQAAKYSSRVPLSR
jgi:hypothetical protein